MNRAEQSVAAFMNLLQCSGKQEMKKDNLFAPAAVTYLTINLMYQNFKKQHEFQLLQDKVHTLQVHDEAKVVKKESHRVSARFLCLGSVLEADDIMRLIKVKQFLSKDNQQELLEEILDQTSRLSSLAQMLVCYRKVIKDASVVTNQLLYRYVEDRVFQRLSKCEFKDEDFKEVALFIIGLPRLNKHVLEFVVSVYEKARSVEHFSHFEDILIRCAYNKTPPESLPIALKAPGVKLVQFVKELIEREPESMVMVTSQIKDLLSRMSYNHNNKLEAALDFIVMTLELGCDAWVDLINWESKAPAPVKTIVKQKLQSVFLKLWHNKGCFGDAVHLLSRINRADQPCDLGGQFTMDLMSQGTAAQLSHHVVRRFLALKLLYNSQDSQVLKRFFNDSTRFAQVVIESVGLGQKSVLGYYQILGNDLSNKLLVRYLNGMLMYSPAEFKQFFSEVDRNQLGELFRLKDYRLLSYLRTVATTSVAYNWVRDCAFYRPSRFLVSILIHFIDYLREKEGYMSVRLQIVRTLNLLLIRTPTQALNEQFKKHLPNLVIKMTKEQAIEVFKDVSDKTRLELSRCHEERAFPMVPISLNNA